MNEEVLRIQRMVAEGKVSAEESVELLESVGGPPPGAARAADKGDDVAAIEKKYRRELLYHRLALVLALVGVFICFKLYAEARRERNALQEKKAALEHEVAKLTEERQATGGYLEVKSFQVKILDERNEARREAERWKARCEAFGEELARLASEKATLQQKLETLQPRDQ